MRKVRQYVATLLLVTILGGVISPSLNVYAASNYMPADSASNVIVWSDVADKAGSFTVDGVTFPFFTDNPISTNSYGFNASLEELALGAIPDAATGTPEEYAAKLRDNNDVFPIGTNTGTIQNFPVRMLMNAYAVKQYSLYASSVPGGNPDAAQYGSSYDSGSSLSFTVGEENYKVEGSFIKFIYDLDSGQAWKDIGGSAGSLEDDPETFKTMMGLMGGNPAANALTKSNVKDTPESDEWRADVMAAAYGNILEFYAYATAYRSKIYDGDSDAAPYKTDTDVATTLAALEKIVMHMDSFYPILGALWEYHPANELSLKDMNETAGGEYVAGDIDIKLDSTFDKVLDETTPLGLFYVINGENGIARIDKKSVLNDIEVDEESNGLVQEFLDGIHGIASGVTLKDDEKFREGVISGVANLLLTMDASIAGSIDAEGSAVSVGAVSMSDYITQGMAYSATYVPMKTNLYSPDTLAQFDQEFRENFYYKYGFMRKAVLWDKSGTAAVDYYNANGKCTGTLSVITLRDLLESEGNDIALYVDGDFYNADVVKEEANEALSTRNDTNAKLASEITDYVYLVDTLEMLYKEAEETEDAMRWTLALPQKYANLALKLQQSLEEGKSTEQALNALEKELNSKYNYDATTSTNQENLEFADELLEAVQYSTNLVVDDHTLKTGDFSQYSNKTEANLKFCSEFNYRKIEEGEVINNNNRDSIVMPSDQITAYMHAISSYENRLEDEEESQVTVNKYSSYDDYTPMLSWAYVSALYREANYYSLANLVPSNNPIFLASDDLCGIEGAEQWYCNTILNYAFVQNLKSAAQVDFMYTVDLDCPLYVDVFGNILTESGIVVIPAACNATLHPASFKNANVAVGLYTIYGKDYYVPVECEGAAKALFPFFSLDKSEGVYIINGNAVTIGTDSVQYNTIAPYDVSVQNAVVQAYNSYLKNGSATNTNWMAMVNICNEVMRGAPIENIDKAKEGLDIVVERNKAAVVAAVKLEQLIASLKGMTQNTLIAIPDFSRMDDMEYLVAFLVKVLIVLTCAVVIIGVYRDGVSGTLGLRTLWKSLSSIALTFAAVCVIPAVFQLTYYAANKFVLQDEAMRILMLNTEKYQSGVEIGMLDTYTPEDTTDMAIQLDWISVPWYDQLENMLYGSTLANLDVVKEKAYRQSPIYDHFDVTLHDDGVYVTTKQLFDSVNIDYTFNDISLAPDGGGGENASANGMYLYSDNSLQTAGWYSPYYAFLTALVANVNEYNYYHSTYNYTTKYMSGNRLKTVGLGNSYFTSKSFMELDGDIMHIYEIYDDPRVKTYDHGFIFTDADKEMFSNSYWYNTIDEEHLTKRVELMNKYARDFIANNQDLLMKVSDETFIKVMALNMAIKYNQLFGIPSANALEIYNMDSNDLLRLSIVKNDEAVLASPMSYARYVYNFGGEPAVYAAAVLTVIMWVGAFIKPLCTVIVFISVFASIWVFRVVLRKPSANLWGYCITVFLLCITNVLHAGILKISVHLPGLGLSTLGCLLFIIFGQVVYLLLLGYVTGVSLKDWSNLGFAEYDREAKRVQRKIGSKRMAQDNLNGRLPHHDNNWDYYNDLVEQHRARNS